MKNQQSTGPPYILSSVMMFENSFQPASVRLIQASQNADITSMNRANGWAEAGWGPDVGSSGHRELLNRYADQPRQQFGGFRQGVPEVIAPRLPGKAPFQALAQSFTDFAEFSSLATPVCNRSGASGCVPARRSGSMRSRLQRIADNHRCRAVGRSQVTALFLTLPHICRQSRGKNEL